MASTTLSLSGLVVMASAAPASAAVPEPVCDATSCTVTLGYTGVLESFTVPTAVTELEVRVSGASGGDARQEFGSAGGQGGTTRATMSTVPGTSLEILVGDAGRTGGSQSIGGGGGTSAASYLGSGGGGSFVFRADGTPAVVSGGGGGAGGINWGPVPGGEGAGAGFSGGDGSTVAFYNPSTPARGGSTSAGGAGSTNRVNSNGLAGAGPSANFAPGAGGDSGRYQYGGEYDGGGGGGGYYGGGGGGYADAGAGGSGYAAPDVSVVTSTVGGGTGNGVVTLGWARAVQPVTFTSDAGSPRVGQTYQVAATGGDSGNPVTFSSATSDVCTVSGSTVSVLKAGTCTVHADQAGTNSYQAGTAAQSVSVSRGDSAVPTVKVRGVRDGAGYLGVDPRHSCQATDGSSGVLSCKVIAQRGYHGRTVLTATAVDRAGNVATDRVTYWVNRRNLVGATRDQGAWEVRRGRTYTLEAMAGVRPRLVRAVPGVRRPRHLGARFDRSGSVAGVARWTSRVTMSMSVSRTRTWTIGVRDGRGLHRIKVRVVG